jgi:hypothetical protein
MRDRARSALLFCFCSLLGAPAVPGIAAEGDESAEPAVAAEAAKPQPVTQITGSAPAETLQERMERFKREKGAGSDRPFDGFAAQAEADMQRQREEAIAGRTVEDADADQSVENRVAARERLQDALARLGAWGGSLCTEIEPAWSTQEDFIRFRKLNAGDFQSERNKTPAAVSVSGAAPTGFAAILFSCEIQPLVQQVAEKQWIARPARVRYYAVLSRQQSWLAEHPESREAFMLGHQQLHFDMANEYANWLNKDREARIAGVDAVGLSAADAMGKLQLKWGEHMLAVHEDFDALETAFDRDTKHGASSEKQTEWSFRLDDGFEALAKGVKLKTRPKPPAR